MTIPEPRTIAGRYRCSELLGSGGMADVHRARDVLLERDVAVKLLRATSTDDVARARFAAEARTLASLNHPNLVLVLDAGTDGDAPYLVMELIDGPTLGQRLRDLGPLPVDVVAALGGQIADGLARAHARGVVHRDVKPGNILLRSTGQAVLADFGIARMLGNRTELTNAGEVIGSPAYLAPEQVSGEEASSPVDVYSLGLVLLEAATGERSYTGTPIEAAIARLSTPPTIPVSLGSGLVGLLTAMTALDPAARPTAAEVSERLATLGGPPAAPVPAAALTASDTQPLTSLGPLDATLVGLPASPAAPRRRPRARVLAAGAVAAAVLLAGAALTTQLGADQVAADPSPAPSATPSAVASKPSPTPTRTEAVSVRAPAAAPAPKKPKPAAAKPKKSKKPPGKRKGRR